MPVSTAALIQSGENYLFVKRPPGGDLGECWELPGGKVDEQESAREALSRELLEELGIEADVGEQVGSSSFAHNRERYTLLAFHTEAVTGSFVLHEHTDYRWCTLAEALEMDLAPSDRDLILSMLNL